jgi:hypothetical protein
MRQALQLEQAQDEGIVVVEAGVSEVSVAKQDMYDKVEDHDGIAIGSGRL